jgi:hypothetical protein
MAVPIEITKKQSGLLLLPLLPDTKLSPIQQPYTEVLVVLYHGELFGDGNLISAEHLKQRACLPAGAFSLVR